MEKVDTEKERADMPLTPEKKEELMRLAAKYMDEAKELRNVLYQKERELAEKLKAGAPEEEVASLRAEIEEIGRRIEDLVALHRYALRMTRISDEELWGEFLGDIRRVIAEPPRRGGESPEEIEERRRFARRLYEMAEEGLEEGVLLRKNPVREAIMAIRKATIELDPEGFREAALETKEKILERIDEVLSLLDEYKAAFESLTPEQVDFSEPERVGQASARRLQQAHINAAERVKTVLEMVRREFEQEGLVKLTEETDMHLRFWTGQGADFASSVSQFVNWFVRDEETERRLRDIALKIDAKLGWVGNLYKHYKEYLRQYEDLSRLPPEERPKIEVGWWPGVWEEVMSRIKREVGGGG
jgi:hypothetical protein